MAKFPLIQGLRNKAPSKGRKTHEVQPPVKVEAAPTGRRRYDPNLKRCRADSIYYRKNPDGTTTKLSRGRFVSCTKQIKSSKAYRKGAQFEGAEEWEMVVSPTWVAPADRATKTQRVALADLLPKPRKKPAKKPKAKPRVAAEDGPEQTLAALPDNVHDIFGGSRGIPSKHKHALPSHLGLSSLTQKRVR